MLSDVVPEAKPGWGGPGRASILGVSPYPTRPMLHLNDGSPAEAGLEVWIEDGDDLYPARIATPLSVRVDLVQVELSRESSLTAGLEGDCSLYVDAQSLRRRG